MGGFGAMSGLMAEVPTMPQQFPIPGSFDQQQMQQMQQITMMAMAAQAAAGAAGGTGPGIGLGSPPLGLPQTPAGDSGCPAYAAMFMQYLQQQAQVYACSSDPTGMSASMGALPPPFPAVGPPYTPPSAPTTPAIAVSVDGMKFQYQLTEDDLHKVFSRYGTVKHIHVDEAGTTAQITFQEFQHAESAMTDLNGKLLNGLDGTLRLVWANQGATAVAPPPYSMMPPFPQWFPGSNGAPASSGATAPTAAPGSSATAGEASTSPPPLAGLGEAKALAAPAHVKGVRKYTCRFLIGIENDKEFQVVRRIIGAKGANMKRIVRQTEAKLRLRGVGSGYFEGAGQRESSEPLQLCVSCTSSEGYRTAVRLVEELLETVYGEYRQFCQENGRPQPDLHASPQLVSAGGRNSGGWSAAGGGTNEGIGSPRSAIAAACSVNSAGAGSGDSGAEDESPGGKQGNRRRGRRSRTKKGESGNAGVERGDPPPKAPPVDEIERLIDQRNEARRQCNFTEADRIRRSLYEKGVALMDEPGARGKGAEVTTWRYWRE